MPNSRDLECKRQGLQLRIFKTRLRKTALSTKPSVVERMILAMRGRAQAIWEAGGGDIKRD